VAFLNRNFMFHANVKRQTYRNKKDYRNDNIPDQLAALDFHVFSISDF